MQGTDSGATSQPIHPLRTVVNMKFFSRSTPPVSVVLEPSTHEWAEYNLPADLALACADDHVFDAVAPQQILSSGDDVV